MRPHRLILLLISIVLVGGSLGATAGYGLYYGSDAYRRATEEDLSRFFEMPVEIGNVRPHSFETRVFEDVVLWLPDRRGRDRVFTCKEAHWHEREIDGRPVNELDLIHGQLNLGTDRWQTTDYYQVLESGLGHNFEDLDLIRVGLSDFEISFMRGGLSIICGGTSGEIDFTDPTEGEARLFAEELNGYRVRQNVRILARFSPKNGVEVSELYLDLPKVPLASIGIGPAVGSDVSGGSFAGAIEYHSDQSDHEVALRGDLTDVQLAEFTKKLPFGPIIGQLSVAVDEARLSQSVITHLQGRGRVTGLQLDAFAPLVNLPALSGCADLNIQWVDLALGHINRLVVDGHLSDLSLEQILRRWGRGSATGMLAIKVNSFRVVDDGIQAADIEISAVPPRGEPGTIDRALILDVAEKLGGFSWPTWLPTQLIPEKIEYTQFGLVLSIRDNKLRVLGAHGKDGETILSLNILGREWSAYKEPSGVIDLTPWIDTFLEKARQYDSDRVRTWWKSARRSGE